MKNLLEEEVEDVFSIDEAKEKIVKIINNNKKKRSYSNSGKR